MTGISIIVDVTDEAIRKAFSRLESGMERTEPLMDAIGTGVAGSTHMRFATQTDPEGASWTALNPGYAAGKRNSRILTESGRLRDSINAQSSKNEARVGTNLVYSAIHQFGGTITPKSSSHLFFRIGGVPVAAKSVTIPARPYLGISADDETMIANVVFAFIDRLLPQ